jgi:hypothetical protein
MPDMTVPDAGLTDLGPFFDRYDRKNRRVMGAALCAGLILSAAIVAHELAAGAPDAKPAGLVWGMGVAFAPALATGWWIFAESMIRQRRRVSPRDGGQRASPQDAHNAMRIAKAGLVFTIVLMAGAIAQQLLIALLVFGYPVGHAAGTLYARLSMVAAGAAMIYLGNVWPMMPTPRTPQPKAAAMMKAYRFGGWLQVTVGLAIVLLGLFLPFLHSPIQAPHS